MNQKTFVLVHGAWHGGWCWVRVATLLRAQEHAVFTPTLTGLGERAHLLGPDIDLSTHITDVVNLMKWEDLDGVTLCGHSYGGMVISGVAEQMERAISSLVFLDAFLPKNGEAVEDITAPVVKENMRIAREKDEHGIAAAPGGDILRQRKRLRLGRWAVRAAADEKLHRENKTDRRARTHREEELYPRRRLCQSRVRPRARRGQSRSVMAHLFDAMWA
ncbi:MAG TPA: alpha/beta fold hydrolase [Pseudolabrys sp.]|nr:alpha/beta fold hydrolase [Pseudolabrys sp.]